MNCPHCQIDLTGEPIPAEVRKYHTDNETHYLRTRSGEYEGERACPDCGGIWKA